MLLGYWIGRLTISSFQRHCSLCHEQEIETDFLCFDLIAHFVDVLEEGKVFADEGCLSV